MEDNNKNDSKKIIITISVIIIFVLLISSIFFIAYFLDKKIEEERNRHVVNNNIQKNEIVEENNVPIEEISNETIIDNADEVLDRSFGKIEIVWIDNENNVIDKPNEPILDGMNPVVYDTKISNFVTTNKQDNNWYNYNSKKWANAVDENGSLFVWVPRYAYKIVYYSNSYYNNVIGYMDSRGLLKENDDGTLTRILNNNVGLKSTGNHYIVHPAFMNDNGSGYMNGGWDSDLSGIWIAKFETSMEVNGEHVETNNHSIGDVLISDEVKAVSKPGVSSWRNISAGNSYYNAYNYNRERESHLMKNSEWGAIAYLAYSNYGTESKGVSLNNSQGYITGNNNTISEIYNYKTKQTSNGNNTGIYDLVGSAWEYVAGYIDNGFARLQKNGSYLYEGKRSNKYKTIYANHESDEGNKKINKIYANNNYLMNVLLRGDGIVETSLNGYGSTSWNTNSAYFPQQDVPFIIRGGDYASKTSSGLFAFNCTSGSSNSTEGYRIVLVCE